VVTGGGFTTGAAVNVKDSHANAALTGWTVVAADPTATASTMTVEAICAPPT
jgi:hypothetical protein